VCSRNLPGENVLRDVILYLDSEGSLEFLFTMVRKEKWTSEFTAVNLGQV
jgi:hypothetical protein